jgi:HK97 gp10 family phage protein
VDRLSTLPDKLQKKGARAATRKAANVIRNAARAKAKQLDDSESPSAIWKNIATQESGKAGRRIGGIVMRVGVRGGAGRGPKIENTGLAGGDTRHWRHIEFGTEKVGARPFMRPALENNMAQVADVLAVELSNELDKLTK